ncbi:MAG: hypothetical protein ACRDNK_12525 [Solirubrobacteraceae bacterium]
MKWAAVPVLAAALAISACGLNVRSADLFVLTRTGQGSKLTLLVNDGGTIRCDGGKSRRLSDAFLIRARDLSVNLADDASKSLSLPAGPGTVFSYRIKLQQGTVRFSDRNTAHHPILAQAELFAAQAAQQACGLD